MSAHRVDGPDRPVIHHVYANRSNAGDWLSARGIQRLLEGVEVIEHLCDEPFIPETLAELALLGHNDVVVIGGGGLLMSYFADFWTGVLELDAVLCLWGVGVVDLKREPSLLPAAILRRIGDRAELAIVRDGRTAELLGGGRVLVAPCPSVVAIDTEPRGESGFLHVANMTTVGETEYRQMRATGLDWAAHTGRVFRETNNRHAPNEAGFQAVLDGYRRSDVVLSSGLHGCLISAAMGRPVVAVSGDHKIDEMMRLFGLDDWLLGQDDLDHVVDAVEDALARQLPPGDALARAKTANERVAQTIRDIATPSRATSTEGLRHSASVTP